MGVAMLAGWLDDGLDAKQIIVQDPAPPPRGKELLAKHGITAQATIASLPAPPAVIVVAVKPQVMDEVFPPLARLAGKSTVVLSIAAGRTIAGFEKHLPKGTAVVRSMPNTPAAIQRGVTVAVPNAHVTPAQRAACDALLRAVGEVAWVDDEGLLDAVTAVSGSGPAYVFYLAECLAEAGVKAGSRRSWRRSWRAARSPARASCCTAPTSAPTRCARTSPRPAAPRLPPCRC